MIFIETHNVLKEKFVCEVLPHTNQKLFLSVIKHPLKPLGYFVVLSLKFFGTGLWYKSQYLREAQVNILADDVCRHEDYYANKITDNMFCAGRPDWSQDACQVFPTSPG